MFSYDFHENKIKNQAIYGPSRAMKAISAFFIIPISIGLYLAISENTFNATSIVPCIILFLLVLTLLFRDHWIFDSDRKAIEYVFGFGPFVKRETYRFRDIERIEVTHFIKGIPEYSENQKASWRHKAQVVLALRLNEDEKKVIEVMGEKKSAGKLERNASWLAGFTGLSLFVDRPRDTRL